VEGSVVWAAVAVGGMALRDVTGGSTAPAFVAVAVGTLGALLMGWRALYRRFIPAA
jgi:hypothetical protein